MRSPLDIVVVGAGHAGVQLCSQLRTEGFDGRIHLISNEGIHPYHRPPLSKAYLSGDVPPTLLRPAEFYQTRAIELRRGVTAERIDVRQRHIALSDGTAQRYDRLVLATGARNRTLPVEGDGRHVYAIRTLQDADAFRQRLRDADRLAIVGGGFIGLELAACASKLGKHVTLIEAQDRLMARAVSPSTSSHMLDLHRQQGVEVLLQTQLRHIAGNEAGVLLETTEGQTIAAQALVTGIGVVAEDLLATKAGLATGDGIIVDAQLRTSDPAIYAIGDCARFPWSGTGLTTRLECVQNAVDQAGHVASQILKGPSPYAKIAWFWSDQYSTRLQIAGVPHGVTSEVRRSAPGAAGFTVFAFNGDRLVCAESCDRPGDHVLARRVLEQGLPFSPAQAADPSVSLARLSEAEKLMEAS